MEDRRKYPRVRAMVFFRPARWSRRRSLHDISEGGIGVYSDEPLQIGDRLEIELFFPDSTEIKTVATVAWQKELGSDASARYHIGLAFLGLPKEARDHIASFVEEAFEEARAGTHRETLVH